VRARAKGYAALVVGLVLAAGLAGVLGLEPFDLGDSESNQAAGRQKRPSVRSTSGSLDRLIADFGERLSDDSAYREPRGRDAARLARAFRAARAGRLNRAAALAAPIGYRVVRYLDVDSRRRLVLLVERRPIRRGWGMYVHSPTSGSRLIVEVAHPGSDIKSERVGSAVFRLADAADLLVAGALRYAGDDDSADVAHNDRSVFDAVHRAVLARGSTVLQPHGFDSARRGVEYGDIVVSSGAAPTELVRSLARGFETRGFETCLYREGLCEGLGGTTNVQGRSARATRASFVHLELARRLRESRRLRGRISAIVAGCLSDTPRSLRVPCYRP
jgi:hypothetical protein